MTWVSVGTTAVGVAGSYLSKKQSGGAAAMAGPGPVSGDFGSTSVGPGGMKFNLDPMGQQWADLAQKLGLDQLHNFKSNPMDALTGDQSRMGSNYDSVLSNAQGQSGTEANSLFAALQHMGNNPTEVANSRYKILSDQAAPGESLARNANQQKLFSQGRLGTTGGSLDTKALLDSQGNSDLMRQAAGQDYGMQWQKQMGDMFSQFSGMNQNSGAMRYGLANDLINQGRAGNDYTMNSSSGMDALYQQMFAPMFKAQGLNSGNPEGAKMTNDANNNQLDAFTGLADNLVKGGVSAYQGYKTRQGMKQLNGGFTNTPGGVTWHE